jgi:hypothetical protein
VLTRIGSSKLEKSEERKHSVSRFQERTGGEIKRAVKREDCILILVFTDHSWCRSYLVKLGSKLLWSLKGKMVKGQ